jgi:hypothetical protein
MEGCPVKQQERAVITDTLIAVEQYLTTLVLVALQMPGPHGVAALDAARTNLIDKVEAFMKAADK